MKVILILSLVFVHLISDALTVGYKYWDAPFNDEDYAAYDKSSVNGITLSRNISEDYYISGNFLVGTYEQSFVDGSYSDTYERDVRNIEIIVAKSGDIFDYGVGLRSIDWASGGTYSYLDGSGELQTGSYGSDVHVLALLAYLGYSKSFTDNIGLYTGFSYAIEISEDGDYDDEWNHSNFEAGLYYAGIINEDITATLGFRKLEFYDDFDTAQEGFTFSVAYNY
jgi:hypothetical protein